MKQQKQAQTITFKHDVCRQVNVEGKNRVFRSEIDGTIEAFLCRQCQIELPYKDKHRKFLLINVLQMKYLALTKSSKYLGATEIVYLCQFCNRSPDFDKIRFYSLSKVQKILQTKRQEVRFVCKTGKVKQLFITPFSFENELHFLVRFPNGVLKWFGEKAVKGFTLDE